MEDQRRDIGKGICFLALMFYSLIFSVRCQSVPSMTVGASPNMTVQQEGTTVSLLCHVSGFNASIHFLSWVKVNRRQGMTIASSHQGLHVNRDERYCERFTEGVISTFNLTVSKVQTSDKGTYVCSLGRRIDDTTSVKVVDKKLVLSVYPRDVFPSCSPNGPEAVTVGSPISCTTSGKAPPLIEDKTGKWTVNSGENGGVILQKNVTNSDSSQMYFCVAKIPSSDIRLFCTIGPLNVVDLKSTIPPQITTIGRLNAVDIESTIPPKITTIGRLNTVDIESTIPPQIITTGITVVTAGLSAGQITGIVIGVVVLIIIIAIHTLCCRCDPRRWMLVKDFLIDCGRSRKTSQAREDTFRSPPDVPMSREGDDVPHVHCSIIASNSMSNSQPGIPFIIYPLNKRNIPADPYVELNIADKKPSQYEELKL